MTDTGVTKVLWEANPRNRNLSKIDAGLEVRLRTTADRDGAAGRDGRRHFQRPEDHPSEHMVL
jgi:hypothetical protein